MIRSPAEHATPRIARHFSRPVTSGRLKPRSSSAPSLAVISHCIPRQHPSSVWVAASCRSSWRCGGRDLGCQAQNRTHMSPVGGRAGAFRPQLQSNVALQRVAFRWLSAWPGRAVCAQQAPQVYNICLNRPRRVKAQLRSQGQASRVLLLPSEHSALVLMKAGSQDAMLCDVVN